MRYTPTRVFAEGDYPGNPHIVVQATGDLSPERMQAIATEVGHSETSFLLHDDHADGTYPIRVFSASGELDFAGHPALAAAAVINTHVDPEAVPEVVLRFPVGLVPVVMGPQRRLWMRVPAPEFGKTYEPTTLAAILGLTTADIDPRFPIQAVATGLPTIIVPLRSPDAVARCTVDTAALDDLLGRTRARLAGEMVLVFSAEARDPANDLRVRVFAHRYGAAEDSGTGSANGALAAWLAAQRYLGQPDIGCQVEQGLEMGQACRLHLRSELTHDGIQVSVGGHVELGAPGVWPD